MLKSLSLIWFGQPFWILMRITGCNFIPRLWFSAPGSAFLTLLLAIDFFHGLGNSQSYGEKRDEEAVRQIVRKRSNDTGFQNILAYMPTLPDYPGVSRIRNESPGLPYGSLNLPDKNDSNLSQTFLHSRLKLHPQV